jgi:hypothetical protein
MQDGSNRWIRERQRETNKKRKEEEHRTEYVLLQVGGDDKQAVHVAHQTSTCKFTSNDGISVD